MKDFFTDKDGDWAIWQAPNFLLWSWLAMKALGFAVKTGHLHNLADTLAFGVLFAWAWLEITSGISWFRRALGVVVLVALVKSRV